MTFPIQISYRNVEASPAVEEWVRKEAEKLETFHRGILRCRVVLEVAHRHLRRGNRFQARVLLSVPGGQVAASSEAAPVDPEKLLEEGKKVKRYEIEAPHKDLRLAIADAFRAAARRLQDLLKRQRKQVKRHETNLARVVELFIDRGFGFLETSEGRRLYFHQHSVLNGAFKQLSLGTRVSFAEEKGEQGPQASTVRLVHSSRRPKRVTAAA
jgi:cold shock CspA family protein